MSETQVTQLTKKILYQTKPFDGAQGAVTMRSWHKHRSKCQLLGENVKILFLFLGQVALADFPIT